MWRNVIDWAIKSKEDAEKLKFRLEDLKQENMTLRHEWKNLSAKVDGYYKKDLEEGQNRC